MTSLILNLILRTLSILSLFLLTITCNSQKLMPGFKVDLSCQFLNTSKIEKKFWTFSFEDNGLSIHNFKMEKSVFPTPFLEGYLEYFFYKKKDLLFSYKVGLGTRFLNYNLLYTGDFVDTSRGLLPFVFSINRHAVDLSISNSLGCRFRGFYIENGFLIMVLIKNASEFSYSLDNVVKTSNKMQQTLLSGVGHGSEGALRFAYRINIGYTIIFSKLLITPTLNIQLGLFDNERFIYGQARNQFLVPLNSIGLGCAFSLSIKR